MGFNLFEKLDRSRQLRKSREDSRKRAEVFEELGDPKTGALANRFFELSKGLVSVGTFGQGAESEEYKKIKEEYDKILDEHKEDLFIYLTRKFVKMKRKNISWEDRSENHWRYIFLRPEYLEEFGEDLNLGAEELRILCDEIEMRLNENFEKIRRFGKKPPREESGEVKRAREFVEIDRKNLDAIKPLLQKALRQK